MRTTTTATLTATPRKTRTTDPFYYIEREKPFRRQERAYECAWRTNTTKPVH